MSLVTAPAVPLPTTFTAAACALVALAPVTAFSADSCAAEPCAGKVACPVADSLEDEVLLLGVAAVVAALALSVPASTPPVIAPGATRPAAPAQRADRPRGLVESFIVPPCSWPPHRRPMDMTIGSPPVQSLCPTCGARSTSGTTRQGVMPKAHRPAPTSAGSDQTDRPAKAAAC